MGSLADETGKPLIKGGVAERWCVFRSGSFGASIGEEDEPPLAVIPEGDFVLMIEVPEDFAKKYEVVERSQGSTDEREETSSTDREFWLPEEVAIGSRNASDRCSAYPPLLGAPLVIGTPFHLRIVPTAVDQRCKLDSPPG